MTSSRKNSLFFVALLLLLISPMQLMAVEVPAILGNFFSVMMAILQNYIVVIVIAFILLYGGYESYANGHPKSIKWAIIASMFIAGGAMFGPSLIDFMQNTNSGYTGAGAQTTLS
jgi:uncharacterized BrkB/YihY/UPF0761 family membrane protein